jgi:hypothetical protein
MNTLERFLEGVTLGEALRFKGLEIRPIIRPTDNALPYLTLGEAMAKGVIEITEKDLSGSVPELFVKNTGTVDVLILEGEELRGAKQNRIVNTTIIVGAGQEVLIPVSCVERGRWRYNSPSFMAAESVAYPSLRKRTHGSVKASLRRRESFRSDQGEVWNLISLKMSVFNVTSESEAMADIMESHVPESVAEDIRRAIPFQQGQIGFLAFINGGFAGGDVFGSSELCRRQLSKLMRGYFLDAVDRNVAFPKIAPEEILKEVASASHEKFEAVGKGVEGRFETDKVEGAYKVDGETVAHMTMYPR